MTDAESPFRVLAPEELGAPRGYSHGLLAPAGGRVLFVAGQTAADPTDPEEGGAPGGFAHQFGAALRKVLEVVEEAGGRPEQVGRMTVYVTDLAAYRASREELGQVWRDLMGRHYPAMSLVEVTGLVDRGALVEIEATAVLPAGPERG